MVAKYALQQFTVQLPSGTAHTVEIGAHRDSTHAAVTSTPASFWSATPLTSAQVNAVLAGYLGIYPDGPQMS